MSQKIEAGKYISMYGPTVGDKVRLGEHRFIYRSRKRLHSLWR